MFSFGRSARGKGSSRQELRHSGLGVSPLCPFLSMPGAAWSLCWWALRALARGKYFISGTLTERERDSLARIWQDFVSGLWFRQLFEPEMAVCEVVWH